MAFSRTRPSLGHWWMVCDDPDIDALDGLYGPNPPVATDGFGGWDKVNRLRQRELLVWTGSPTLRIELDVVLRGSLVSKSARSFPGERYSVEDRCRTMEKMAGLTHSGDEPPKIQWAGNFQHDYHHAPDNLWVIETLLYSTDVNDYQWNASGSRSLARATLTMAVWSPTDYIGSPNGAKSHRDKKSRSGSSSGGTSGKVRTYTVRRGDTLGGIASRLLGKYSRWGEIAKLNHIRDPHNLRVGQKLKIPRK